MTPRRRSLQARPRRAYDLSVVRDALLGLFAIWLLVVLWSTAS
jgi:hypothetical protein